MSSKIILNEKVVKVNMSFKDRNELLNYMSKMLIDENYVKETFAKAIIEREDNFSTGLPTLVCGVAIPHTDSIHVNKPMISVVTLKEPIEFLEMGNPEESVLVKIVFMIAMKDSKKQIKILTNLMEIVQNKDLLKEICESNSEKLTRLISNKLCEV